MRRFGGAEAQRAAVRRAEIDGALGRAVLVVARLCASGIVALQQYLLVQAYIHRRALWSPLEHIFVHMYLYYGTAADVPSWQALGLPSGWQRAVLRVASRCEHGVRYKYT